MSSTIITISTVHDYGIHHRNNGLYLHSTIIYKYIKSMGYHEEILVVIEHQSAFYQLAPRIKGPPLRVLYKTRMVCLCLSSTPALSRQPQKSNIFSRVVIVQMLHRHPLDITGNKKKKRRKKVQKGVWRREKIGKSNWEES